MSTGPKDKRGKKEGAEALLDVGVSLRDLLSHPNRARQLDDLTAVAARRSGISGAVLLARKGAAPELVVEAAAGLESLRDRAVLLKAARSLAQWVTVSKGPVIVLDPANDTRIEARNLEARALIAVPVLMFGDPLGALVGFWIDSGEKADPGQALPILQVMADVIGLLLQLLRGTDEITRLARRTKELEAERMRLEKLALTGETTIEVIAEIQKSTAAIAGFARRVLRGLPENDINREYVEVTIGEIERLERLLAEQKKASSLPESPLAMEDVNALIEAVLNERRADIEKRKARVLRRLAVGLPRLLMDRGRIRAAIENIIDHLLESVPRGGRLKVESKRLGDLLSIIIAADGVRSPGATLDRLFVPFHKGGAESGQVGLAAACQIIREHGAEVGVRSEADWPALFVLNFPIKENEDRRRRTDRRSPRTDRRSRRDAA